MKLPLSVIDTEYVHYSAADADEQSDHANCARRVKGIQDFHQNTRGWNDIAYNFLFCKHGYVFEGRGWDVHSAATGNDNSHSVAICFLGDDSEGRDDVTSAGRDALVEFSHAAWLRYDGIEVAGHRDAMSTDCPGDQLYGFIHSRAFKKAVERGSDPNWSYWQWVAWTLGEGDYKGRGPRSKPRPAESVFPRKIPRSWHMRRYLYLYNRQKGK